MKLSDWKKSTPTVPGCYVAEVESEHNGIADYSWEFTRLSKRDIVGEQFEAESDGAEYNFTAVRYWLGPIPDSPNTKVSQPKEDSSE